MLGRLFSRSTENFDLHLPNTNNKQHQHGTRTSNLTNKLSSISLGSSIPMTATASASSTISPPVPNDAANIPHNHINYTNEDSYSRTILYGTPNCLNPDSNPNYKGLDPLNFRLVIVQDKGEILHKNNYKVLFDSSKDSNFDKSLQSNLKNRHQVMELVDFMFGNQVHQDFNTNDKSKIHVLSALDDLRHSILITKHFKIEKKIFAISVVIPVGLKQFSELVLSNWAHIDRYLDLLKTTFIRHHVIKKHPINSVQMGNSNSIHNNQNNSNQLGANSPPAILSNYLDISIIFKNFIKSINNLIIIPRLFIGLNFQFDSILQNWCFETNNWIEIKDGAKLGFSGTKFLTTLLTITNTLKHQLISSPSNNLDGFTRIVIMASNPIVAQKLIFILQGVLPYKFDLITKEGIEADEEEDITEEEHAHSSPPQLVDHSDDDKSAQELDSSKLTPPTPSVISKGWEIPKTPSRSVTNPSSITPSRSSLIQPNTMSTSNSVAYLSSSLQSHSSFSSSLNRGFQYLQNWKNNALDSPTSSSSSVHSYRSPSPALMDYDEYPWTSTSIANNNNNVTTPLGYISSSTSINNALSSSGGGGGGGSSLINMGSNNSQTNSISNISSHSSHLQRTPSCYDLSGNSNHLHHSLRAKKKFAPNLPQIERSNINVYKIGGFQESKNQLYKSTKDDCMKLMKNFNFDYKEEYDPIKDVFVLDIPFDDDGDGDDNYEEEEEYRDPHHFQTLPTLCGYVNEFIPEFQLQACPISYDLESKITTAMKNDLNHYNSSRTVFVSLRTREIKEIQLYKFDNGSKTEFKSSVKKLYHGFKPNLNAINKSDFHKIDNLLENIVRLFHTHAQPAPNNSNVEEAGDNNQESTDFEQIEKLLQQL